MLRLMAGGVFIAAASVVLSGCSVGHRDFGEPLRLAKATEVPVGKVLAEPKAYDGQFVRVSGTVAEVCQHKGCWLTLHEQAGGPTLRVKFICPTGDGRLIPLEAVGRRALVEGTLVLTDVAEAQRRHMAEEAGASPEEISRIVGAAQELRIDSPAARVFDLPAPKPAADGQ